MRRSGAAPPSPDAVIARLAARQHGVVTLAQLFAAGLDEYAVRRRVAAGRLHRIARGVYAVGHAALSREGRWMAAVLACGECAALSHLSAAELWQVSRFCASLIAVVCVSRCRPPGVEAHTVRRLDERDVTRYRGIRVTTVARTLIDLSDVLKPHQLTNVIHEAAFRNRFNVEATRRAMERANGRHNLHVLDRAIEMHLAGSAGTRSANEDALLAQLPDEPLVNTKVHGIEVDLHWPKDGLVIEVDGPGHRRPRTRDEDATREAALIENGYDVVRVKSF